MNQGYLFTDPPHMPCMPKNEDIMVESAGCALYGSLLLAGSEPGAKHPVVLMLHGFPGHEKNLDLAQALRRCGAHAAFFSYRGAWGSQGDYAISNLKQDANAVLRFLLRNAGKFGIDEENIWLLGHSLGGFTALHTLCDASVPVKGAVLIAPCDLGMMFLSQRERFAELVAPEDRTSACLRVAHDGFLHDEAEKYAADWRFASIAEHLQAYPLLFIGGTADEVTPPAAHILPLLKKLPRAQYMEIDDGHAFAASRVALARNIAEWLEEQIG